jgi:hypothetical protein
MARTLVAPGRQIFLMKLDSDTWSALLELKVSALQLFQGFERRVSLRLDVGGEGFGGGGRPEASRFIEAAGDVLDALQVLGHHRELRFQADPMISMSVARHRGSLPSALRVCLSGSRRSVSAS